MDEKLKTEDLYTNSNLNTEEILDGKINKKNIDLQSTQSLLGSVLLKSNFNENNIINNTMMLLNSKVSNNISSNFQRNHIITNKDENLIPSKDKDLSEELEDNDLIISEQEKISEKSRFESKFKLDEVDYNDCKTSFLLEEDNKESRFLKSNKSELYSKLAKESIHSKINSNSISRDNERTKKEEIKEIVSLNSMSHHSRIEIDEVVFIETDIVCFPLSFPGESLTRKFNIKNNSTKEFSIEFNWNSDFKDKKLFNNKNLTKYKDFLPNLENSQTKYSCFQVKSDSKLKEQSSSEFEIELNTPKLNENDDLFAILEIRIEKSCFYLPVIGNVRVPEILVLKELSLDRSLFPIIFLNLKLLMNINQKFKIPLRNYSMKDVDLDLDFENLGNNKIMSLNGFCYDVFINCFPPSISIPSHETVLLEVIVKISKNYSLKINQNINFRSVLKAKLKKSYYQFLFFFEGYFVE